MVEHSCGSATVAKPSPRIVIILPRGLGDGCHLHLADKNMETRSVQHVTSKRQSWGLILTIRLWRQAPSASTQKAEKEGNSCPPGTDSRSHCPSPPEG